MNAVQSGDTVQARQTIREHGDDGGPIAARRRAVGDVLEAHKDGWATICWQTTGMVVTCHPSEFDVLCGVDFATRPETTPKAPLKRFHRGARGTPVPFTPKPFKRS